MNFFYLIRVYSYFYFCLILEGFNNFFNVIKIRQRNRAILPKSLEGKIAVITGASSGIGKLTAIEFAKLGAKVIMACLDSQKSRKSMEDICNELEEYQKSNITLLKLDLSSLKSVRNFADKVNASVSQIDYLINNAGIMMCPEWKSEDGFEMQFATNYLGHFMLTNLLIDKVMAAPAGRIINLTSIAHLTGQIHFDNINLTGEYSPLKAYNQSKLALVLFTQELAKRLNGTSVTVYAVHPGMMHTDLLRHFTKVQMFFLKMWERLILISPKLGIQTTLFCAFDEQLKQESGLYYANCRRVRKRLSHTYNDEDAIRLWDLSCKLCGIYLDINNNNKNNIKNSNLNLKNDNRDNFEVIHL